MAKSKISKKTADKIKIKSRNRAININISDDPLDFYRSPHLLNLSQAKFIERIKPSPSGIDGIFYNNLPAGDILSKLHILELLAIEESEILNWINRLWRQIVRLFVKVDLSPKLPLVKEDKLMNFNNHKLLIWQETALINLFSFLTVGLLRISEFSYLLLQYYRRQMFLSSRIKDEVIDFSFRDGQGLEQELSSDDLITVLGQPPSVANPVFETKSRWLDFIRKKQIAPKVSAIKASHPSHDYRHLIKMPKFNDIDIHFPHIRIPNVHFIWLPENFSFKPILIFALIALMIIGPIKSIGYWRDISEAKGKVLGEAEEALQDLNLAQNELMDFNFILAEDYFSSANESFISAKDELSGIESLATALIEFLPNNIFKSGKNLLGLGENLSAAGHHLLQGFNYLTDNSQDALTQRISAFKIESDFALVELENSVNYLEDINIDHLPQENQEQFIKLQEKLPTLITGLEDFNKTTEFMLSFLGDNTLKRYLFVFQNDNELRATGGFMGSFALVDVKSGDIQNIDMPAGGTYDVRAGLNKLIAAPQPLQLINSRWEFQDSNWWPDWKTSAEQISWFYNKSGGPTIDGVIAINSDWLGYLLEVTGDIELVDYNKIISAANFEMELQKSVEIEYEEITKPKKILGDLAPKLIDRIFNVDQKNFLDLLLAINKGLSQKDILIHLTDEELEKFIADNDWDGRIKDSEKDYLNVVATNIGGGKTDNVIKQKINHQAKILADGTVIDSLLINRYHFGPIESYFTNLPNRIYLRVYVPEGSELIRAAGFNQPDQDDFKEIEDFLIEDEKLESENTAEIDLISKTKIYNEGNKTVFANWLTIKPGDSQDVLLVYKLPFKVGEPKEDNQPGIWGRVFASFLPKNNYDSYSLLVQKQPGSGNDEFISELIYPEDISSQIFYPKSITNQENKIIFKDSLDSDLFYFSGFQY